MTQPKAVSMVQFTRLFVVTIALLSAGPACGGLVTRADLSRREAMQPPRSNEPKAQSRKLAAATVTTVATTKDFEAAPSSDPEIEAIEAALGTGGDGAASEPGAESATAEIAVPASESGAIPIPVVHNESVQKWIEYFTVKDRERFQRFLNRGDIYKQVVEDMLEENELPADLYYLAMIESGYRNDAHSHASAVGAWQFIHGTAIRYGLRVNEYVDERRDPIRATEAASKYLKDLYNAFGSWYLAMAAYNAGEMRVLRAVFRGKSRDFWTLVERGVLPSETANYVPKFLAVVIIGQDPGKYGFRTGGSPRYPDVQAVGVPGAVSLEAVASAAGVGVEELRRLNPNLKKGLTPPGADYELWIPSAKAPVLQAARGTLEKKVNPRAVATNANSDQERTLHVVRRGESLGLLAQRYKMSIAHLKRINGLRTNQVQIGQKLRVKTGVYRGSTLVRYKVRRGDNLTLIARRFGVTVADIKRKNQLKRNQLHVGQILKVMPRL